MIDKYEEFKKWFKHHPIDEDELDLVFAIGNLFREFDKYYEENQHKKEIINIIWDTILDNIVNIEYKIDGMRYKEHPAEAVYNKLKEKGIIK